MTGTENESRHFEQAEKWLHDAELAYRDFDPRDAGPRDLAEVAVMQKFAELHYLAAQASDIDREATAEQRIASCVPDGSARLQITGAGR